jgi:hypothetical protein
MVQTSQVDDPVATPQRFERRAPESVNDVSNVSEIETLIQVAVQVLVIVSV